jgi:hypothetical protein
LRCVQRHPWGAGCVARRAWARACIVALLLAGGPAAAADEDLAAQARDPTAAITAFQIRYDWTASFHNLPNQDLGTVVVQPIIPFKIGAQRHIARITVPYITNAPDISSAGGAIDQNPIPPNYIPTSNVRGLGDSTILDVLLFDRDWGRLGVGGVLSVPTATNSALGTGKWSLGPALVGIGRSGKWQYGVLGMGLFSVAGPSDRQNVSAVTLQPFASYDLGNNWSVGMSEVSYTYNFRQSRWADVPIGGRIEKLVQLGKVPVRIFVDAEYNLRNDDIAPRWTFRLAFIPLL